MSSKKWNWRWERDHPPIHKIRSVSPYGPICGQLGEVQLTIKNAEVTCSRCETIILQSLIKEAAESKRHMENL